MKKNTTKQLLTFVIMLIACIALTACAIKSEDKHAQKSDSKVSEKLQDKTTNTKGTVNDNDIEKDINRDNIKRKDKTDRNITDKAEPNSSEVDTVDISTVNKDELQQALTEYRFSLEGSSFDMSTHIKISDLEAIGYSIKDSYDTNTEIQPHKYSLTSVDLEHTNGNIISITVCNPSEETIKFKDADLYTITIEYSDEVNADFCINNADIIKLNAIMLEQFDELTSGMEHLEVYDGDNYNSRTIYTQSENYYSRNKYTFTFVNGVLDNIKITYM